MSPLIDNTETHLDPDYNTYRHASYFCGRLSIRTALLVAAGSVTKLGVGEAEGYVAVKKYIGKYIIPDNRVQHIFRDAEGHVLDTPANREMLLGITKEASSYLGSDQFGNQWFAIITVDGKQIWTQTRANEIINGGLNLIIRTFNPLTGLSQP